LPTEPVAGPGGGPLPEGNPDPGAAAAWTTAAGPNGAVPPAFSVALLGAAAIGGVWLVGWRWKHFYAHDYLLTEVLLGIAAAAGVASAIAALVGFRAARGRAKADAGSIADLGVDRPADP